MARILIVDDSPTDVQNVKNILQKAGHIVVEASNAQDVVERVKQEKPDCVVMDVVMPGINGFQATRTLSRDPLTKDIPVIVCSTKNQETDRVWALRQGARDYIVKPAKPDELINKIRAALGA
jgi:twitching motility two-component system response regulator PilH